MISLRQHLKTRRPRSGRPKPYSHWYFLAFCGNRPDTDNDIDGACRRRQVPLQLPQQVFDGQSPSRADAAIIQHERFRYAQWLLQGSEFRMNASHKQMAIMIFLINGLHFARISYERMQFRAPCWRALIENMSAGRSVLSTYFLGNGLYVVLIGRIPVERFTFCVRKGGALPMDGVQFVFPFCASFLLHCLHLAFPSILYS